MRGISLVCLCLLPFMAIAQGLPPDDGGFEIETESDTVQTESLTAKLEQYVGGSIGLVQAEGDVVDRTIAALHLDINLPATRRVKTAFSVDVVDYDITYRQKLRDSVRRDREYGCLNGNSALCEALPDTQERKVVGDETTIREAYLHWEATDWASLRLGRQTMVWGQFDYFSPVSFLTPIRTGNTVPRATKADFALAQDALAVSLFPLANLEVQFIHAPQMRMDKAQRDSFETFAEDCRSLRHFFAEGEACDDARPDPGDIDLSVARLAYFGDQTQWAVTFMEGLDQFSEPVRRARLQQTSNGAYELINVGPRAFTASQAWGVEWSRRLTNSWTLRGEYTEQEIRDDIDLFLLNQQDNDNQWQELANLMAANNRTYFDSIQQIAALGALYEGDVWTINVQLMSFDTVAKDRLDADLERAEEVAYGENDDDDASSIAPIFNVARRLGAENQGYFSFGAGAFFNAYGFGLFGGWTFAEKIRIGGLVGVTAHVSDDGDFDDEHYETVDEGDTLVQLGVNYLF